MTEHEKLKGICNLIKYDYYDFFSWNIMDNKFYPWYNREAKQDEFEWDPVSVREIIFTPEFRDCFIEYSFESSDYDWYETFKDIWEHLSNPITYLYNTLGLWTKQEKE